MRLARSVEPRRERTLGIGPLVIGNERIPAGPAGIAVVRIAAELTEKLVIARELVAVERDTETGRMPPQNVVSSRITSTARVTTLDASCSKLMMTVFVAVGSGTNSFSRASCGMPHTGSSK